MSSLRGHFANASVAIGSVLLAAWLAPPMSQAEVTQEAGVRVTVSAKVRPDRLPRREEAPVAVRIVGHFASVDRAVLPKLEEIVLAINSHARLGSGELPVCRYGHISPATTAQALAACRSSLIGEGRFSADVRIPEQSPFPSEGKLLAFNGRLHGKPAVFAHIYGTEPVPTSYVLPFMLREGKGRYRAVLTASLPRVTGEWGYVTGISLNLRPPFISASCPAPAGFPGAIFPLMKTSFGFAGGVGLDSTLMSNCRVLERSR